MFLVKDILRKCMQSLIDQENESNVAFSPICKRNGT